VSTQLLAQDHGVRSKSITDLVKAVCTTGVACLSLSVYTLTFIATQFCHL